MNNPTSGTELPLCDQEIFEKGVSVGLFDIPKGTAEAICKAMSAVTGHRIDWHYIGGRVHIKALAHPAAQAVDEEAERVVRKAFICTSCDGVYADAPVSSCDCMPEQNTFTEGVITYPAAAPVRAVRIPADQSLQLAKLAGLLEVAVDVLKNVDDLDYTGEGIVADIERELDALARLNGEQP